MTSLAKFGEIGTAAIAFAAATSGTAPPTVCVGVPVSLGIVNVSPGIRTPRSAPDTTPTAIDAAPESPPVISVTLSHELPTSPEPFERRSRKPLCDESFQPVTSVAVPTTVFVPPP